MAFARLSSQADHISRLSLSHPDDIEIVRAYMSELENLRRCEISAPDGLSANLPFDSVEFRQLADNLKIVFPVCIDEDLEKLALQLSANDGSHDDPRADIAHH